MAEVSATTTARAQGFDFSLAGIADLVKRSDLALALGIMAMANRISWGWPMAAMVGIAVVFGAPQMVTWIRGMFGV